MKPSSRTVATIGIGGSAVSLIVWALSEWLDLSIPEEVTNTLGIVADVVLSVLGV